ncbi:MAG: hypothetical protein HDR05_12535 [Lachnospiraceae bacterium]|nr:hypothetical protein [Lachnospiraceae bacterium]
MSNQERPNETNVNSVSKPLIKSVETIIFVLIIISIAINIYEFNANTNIKNEISTLQSDLETKETEQNTLSDSLETKKQELADLQVQIEDLNSTITTLEADNKSLTDSLQELQKELEEKEADINNNSLSAEDRQAEVDAALERAKQRHPDWFQDDSTTTTGNNQGNYEHVGTPDNGVIPEYTIGESGSEGITPGTIY